MVGFVGRGFVKEAEGLKSTIAGGLIGAGIGASKNKEHRLRNALIGAGVGGAFGLGARKAVAWAEKQKDLDLSNKLKEAVKGYRINLEKYYPK